MVERNLSTLEGIGLQGEVRQESYGSKAENQLMTARMTPRGELVTSDIMQQMVFDGNAFLVSNTARETALASGTSFSDTAPFAVLDCPNGYTMIPLQIWIATKVDDKTHECLVTMSDKLRYTSGGTAHVPQNLRFDEPKGSACTFVSMGSAITAVANTDDITLCAYHAQIEGFEDETPGILDWTAKRFIAPAMVGPSSLVIFHYGSDAMPVHFSIAWGEMSTTDFLRRV